MPSLEALTLASALAALVSTGYFGILRKQLKEKLSEAKKQKEKMAEAEGISESISIDGEFDDDFQREFENFAIRLKYENAEQLQLPPQEIEEMSLEEIKNQMEKLENNR